MKAEATFLYVEDDMLSRKVMEILLTTMLGYSEVFMFDDSSNFLEKMQSLPGVPDVIFLDIQIGPHDGYEMLQMLRDDPAYADRVIVAMTANVMSHDVAQLQQAGFSGLIGKPIIKDIFPELVGKILDGEPVWYVP